MRITVIDGQGGRIGGLLIERIRKLQVPAEITAVGTNSVATAAMLKAGADFGATGENPAVVACRDADLILGPVGIVLADALLGEVTAAMAAAVSRSRAHKILIPLNRCGHHCGRAGAAAGRVYRAGGRGCARLLRGAGAVDVRAAAHARRRCVRAGSHSPAGCMTDAGNNGRIHSGARRRAPRWIEKRCGSMVLPHLFYVCGFCAGSLPRFCQRKAQIDAFLYFKIRNGTVQQYADPLILIHVVSGEKTGPHSERADEEGSLFTASISARSSPFRPSLCFGTSMRTAYHFLFW